MHAGLATLSEPNAKNFDNSQISCLWNVRENGSMIEGIYSLHQDGTKRGVNVPATR